MNSNGQPIETIEGITLVSSDGTTYGPYGGSEGADWKASLEHDCKIIFISGYADDVLQGIGFHYECSEPSKF